MGGRGFHLLEIAHKRLQNQGLTDLQRFPLHFKNQRKNILESILSDEAASFLFQFQLHPRCSGKGPVSCLEKVQL